MNAFNGTILTTFFGFPHTNVQVAIPNETIGGHIVRIENDLLFYNVSQCVYPDRDLPFILYNTRMALICLASFLLQVSMFPVFWRMAKLRGPAFTILIHMLLCSSANIIFFEFILYLEGAIGSRLPIPFDLDYYLRHATDRGEAVFYFLYAFNRSAALLFPFSYSSIFTHRSVFWIIFVGWAYCLLDRAEFFLANKGQNRMHCLAPGPEDVQDGVEIYCVIQDPSMMELESLARKMYYVVWYTPMLMDALTLAKLFHDKYKIQRTRPWIVARPAGAETISEGRNERIRLFMTCLITSSYHFFFAYAMSAYRLFFDVPRSWYNYSYILENVMPYLLLLWISRDVRTQWKRTICCRRGNAADGRIQPIINSSMYPTND